MAVRFLLLGSFLATGVLLAIPGGSSLPLTIASHHPWIADRPTRRSIQQGGSYRRTPGGGGGTCHGTAT